MLISPHVRLDNGDYGGGSRGSVDVLAHLSKFVMDQGKFDKFVTISLMGQTGDDGEGTDTPEPMSDQTQQSPSPTATLSQALSQGNWVFLHHVHCNPHWLARVENLLENASTTTPAPIPLPPSKAPQASFAISSNLNIHGSVHPEFRLWVHCVENVDSQVPVFVTYCSVHDD